MGRDLSVTISSAESFHAVAARTLGFIRGLTPEGSTRKAPSGIGELVCCATNLSLALELYLKALYVQRGDEPPSTHDLGALFQGLSHRARDSVGRRFERIKSNGPRGVSASVTISRGPATPPAWRDYSAVPKSLQEILTRAGDGFVTWRYLFEHHACPPEYEAVEFEYLLLHYACEAVADEIASAPV